MLHRWIDLWLEWLDQFRHLIVPDDCPGHVAHKRDPKRCGHCGEHIDSFRDSNEEESREQA
jgi:hypothetical protein